MAKVSTKGYKKNSKDKNEASLRIPSPMITMKEDDGTPLRKGPILGIDNLGNQQMMYPGMDYQFPGNYVDEIPMAKMGGTRKVKIHSLPKAQGGGGASFQDSLDVANSAQQVIDWYNSQGYYGGSKVGDKEPARSKNGVRMIDMDRAKKAANKPVNKTPLTIGGRQTIGQKDDLGNGGFTIDLPKFEVELPSISSLGEVGAMALAGTVNAIGGIQNLTNENLAEWESPYRFRQYADDHKRVLNTDAPKALYDTRIDPRSTFRLQGTAPGYFSGNADIVDMPIYEKFYTAPWSVLSPEDKRKRLEFGILDGTPFKDWNDPGLIQNYPDIALANGGRRAQGYDEQTIKNAAASGYAPTQEGAAQYEKNKWAKNPRVYDAQTIANAVKSGYPATQSGAAEYELNNWQKKPNSKNSIARKEPNPNTDIAHYMKTELGLDKKQTSYSERKKLAEKYGIKDYSGSAKQNIELLNKIKSEEDPADAVRRMLAGEKLNTVLPTDSQPEDFKVPYKGDPNRRSYPIELSGDAAIDNMRQQLFGNLGKFTDNGKIPLDDPKYNPYVGGIGPRTPEQEMKRIVAPPGGFAYGGQIPMAQMGMGMAPPPPPRPAPMKYLPMKELGLLQMPGIDTTPQLQNIPSIELPQITKQRVVVNTAQGDKIRVQDPKTKKFMWWEDQKGLPSDIENPTGVASQDFQFAYGGQLPMAQRGLGITANIQDKKNVIYNDLDEYNKAHQAEGDSLLAATNTYLLLDHINQVQNSHRFFDNMLHESMRRNDPASHLYYNSLKNKEIKPRTSRLATITPTAINNISGIVPVYDYAFPKTHAVYEELPKPVMKEPTPFPIPTIDVKPYLQNIERPKSNKQRVIINTPEGDKIRVQDLKTKKFLGWEDQERLPSDVENPTGTASQDFVYPEPKVIKTPKFNYGGGLPKAQDGINWSDPFKSSFPEQPKSDWYNTMNTMMPQEQEVDWRGTIESMAKPKPYTVPQEYYDELKILENSVKKGYADGKFYPHESIEGGNKTIGYGHKVTDKDISSGQFKKGLGDAEANKLLEDDVAFNTQRAVERYDTRYGKGSFNKLHPELKKLAVDFTYNGINFTAEGDEYKNSFPTFWGAANQYSTTQDEALKQKALQTMLANYQRGAKTENDGSVILGGRNEYTKNILSNLKKNGGELPKAQNGLATAADSSLVANHANDIVNFYKNAGYTKEGSSPNYGTSPSYPDHREYIFNRLAGERLRPGTSKYGAKYKNGQLQRLSNGDYEPVWDTDIYQKLDNYKFQQRENAQGILNMDSPMQLYDTRISPQYTETFTDNQPGGTLDNVGVYTYDKLAVTPWNKLPDKQKLKRLQKFGTSGSPYKDKAAAIKELKEKLNPPKKEETPVVEVPVIDKPVQIMGQPEDAKIPFKPDVTRRQYPIKLTGDDAIDKMIMKLYGPQGELTDNGYIPLDDPKYNPYVGGIGPTRPVRVSYGKFAEGGDISVPDLRRVKIHALPKAQTGIPADYQKFLQYSETAPENRRPDAEWQYGNPRQYDHYGMWDALGKPKNFDEALTNYPQWQPDEYDGMYHGFSTNPNTGVWLKSHIPGESHPGDTGWMEYKAFMLSNDRNWGGKNQNLVYDPELQRMRYIERKKEGGSLPMAQYGPPDWRNMLDYKNAAPPAKQNLVGDVRKVARPTAVAESTNRNVTHQIPTNTKELKAEADAQAAYDALPEAMKRQDVLTADTRSDAEKFARRGWTAISYPMATISAVNRGHDIPMGSLGMYSPYEGYDVGGPMNFLVDLVAGTPGFIVNAASRQGEQLVDDPLKYSYTMSPLGMLDPETRGQALSNTLDLSAVIPVARMAAGPLVKNTNNFLNAQPFLKDVWKNNPWRFQKNPEAYYHRTPNPANIINTEKGVLQGFGQSPEGMAYNELAIPGKGPGFVTDKGVQTGLNLRKAAHSENYFSKGAPLDWGRYNPGGSGYAGPYIAEVTGVPFVAKANGKFTKILDPVTGKWTRGVYPPSFEGGYAVPKGPVPLGNTKFYKEDWLWGYKQIGTPKSLPNKHLPLIVSGLNNFTEQKKQGGEVKRVKINALPNNWKSQ